MNLFLVNDFTTNNGKNSKGCNTPYSSYMSFLDHTAHRWIYHRVCQACSWYDARPMVTFPGAEHCHCPLASAH